MPDVETDVPQRVQDTADELRLLVTLAGEEKEQVHIGARTHPLAPVPAQRQQSVLAVAPVQGGGVRIQHDRVRRIGDGRRRFEPSGTVPVGGGELFHTLLAEPETGLRRTRRATGL